jgi:hypothetical protein
VAIEFVGVSDRVMARLMKGVGEDIGGILDTTRDMVRGEIERGLADGIGAAELGDRIEAAAAFDEYRAEMVARTETATLLNRAAVESYRAFGVTHVEVIDGDDDEECQAANGQTWTIEEAEANPIAHPNCVRDFSPIVGEPDEPAPTDESDAGQAADIKAGAEKFDNAGGTAETLQGYAGSRQGKAEFAEMAARMPEGWADAPGPHATNSVFNTVGSTVEYHIVRDADGTLAAAMHLVGKSMNYPDAIQISLIGSNGITPGAGSALVREAIREAASQGVGIRLTPLTNAKPFWTRMGLGPDNWGDTGYGWGATPEQIREMAKALGVL